MKYGPHPPPTDREWFIYSRQNVEKLYLHFLFENYPVFYIRPIKNQNFWIHWVSENGRVRSQMTQRKLQCKSLLDKT